MLWGVNVDSIEVGDNLAQLERESDKERLGNGRGGSGVGEGWGYSQ